MTQITARITIRKDTAANWTAANPVLEDGEFGLNTTTDQIKIGDGVTAWNSLAYFSSGASFATLTGDYTDNASLVAGFATKQDRVSALLTGGVITVETIDGTGTLNDIRVTASTYYIVGTGDCSAVETTFLNIANSASTLFRYVDIYGKNDNTIVKVEGVEGTTAAHPSAPANSVLFGSLLVSDGGIIGTGTLSTTGIRRMVLYQNTNSSVTGTLTETILTPNTFFIPAGSMGANSVLHIEALLRRAGALSATITWTAKANTSYSVSGAKQIHATGSNYLASVRTGGFVARIVNKNNIALNNAPSISSYTNDTNSTSAITSPNINWAVDQFILLTATLGNINDEAILDNIQVYITNP